MNDQLIRLENLEQYLMTHAYISPIVAAFIGPSLAFLLSQWSVSRERKLFAAKQSRSVKKMLEFEINQNLDLLSSLQKVLYDKDQKPFPILSSKVFESQINLLPASVDEDKIMPLLRFYNNLDTLKKYHLRLLENEIDYKEAKRKSKLLFKEDADNMAVIYRDETLNLKNIHIDLLEKFVQLIDAILHEGNPL